MSQVPNEMNPPIAYRRWMPFAFVHLWYVLLMPERSSKKRPRDVNELAARIVAESPDQPVRGSTPYMHYNFCCVHKTLGTTPAVKAGVANHVWTIEEMVARLIEREKSVESNDPLPKMQEGEPGQDGVLNWRGRRLAPQ